MAILAETRCMLGGASALPTADQVPVDLGGASIRVGTPSAQVYSCFGWPNHVNSDFHTDQMVYSDGLFVYINRSTDKVENIQWTH